MRVKPCATRCSTRAEAAAGLSSTTLSWAPGGPERSMKTVGNDRLSARSPSAVARVGAKITPVTRSSSIRRRYIASRAGSSSVLQRITRIPAA